MKIATVVGARPQFIKAATVSRAIRQQDGMTEVMIHTGQHYDHNMSDVFFEELEIPKPAHALGIGSGPHGQQTGRMLAEIEAVLEQEKPDWVLVYGDTNSTLAGALAAVKLHIPVAHVEAGLRSFNRRMPEEINRILTDHASDLLFTPTETACVNLRNEGIAEAKLHRVGDVMYDASLYFSERARQQSGILTRLRLENTPYALATLHRAENTDDPRRLRVLLESLARLAKELTVVWPLHPRTRAVLSADPNLAAFTSLLTVIEPVSYLDMVMLESRAKLVATDSGGVQKEAFFFRVPCVTLRDETEWVELVETGWNRLAPPTSVDAVTSVMKKALAAGPGSPCDAYGTGSAAAAIVAELGRQRR
jgi:UDP-GlcNAc3NAcA epimerase